MLYTFCTKARAHWHFLRSQKPQGLLQIHTQIPLASCNFNADRPLSTLTTRSNSLLSTTSRTTTLPPSAAWMSVLRPTTPAGSLPAGSSTVPTEGAKLSNRISTARAAILKKITVGSDPRPFLAGLTILLGKEERAKSDRWRSGKASQLRSNAE